MIRALGMAIGVLVVLHLLGAAGFVVWLGASGRLSAERIGEVRELFAVPVAESERRAAEADADAQRAREIVEQAARLESVADGPMSLEARLARESEADEVALHRLERLNEETEAIRRQIAQAKATLAQQREELEAERAAFEAEVARRQALLQDEDFRQAVTFYERVKPKQAKEMFQRLLAQGEEDQVVDYLAAMQLRKAGAVLREFKEPAEIAQLTALLERLRERGIDLAGGAGQDNGDQI